MSQVTSSSLVAAVAALPEIYQPIYGHDELSGKVSRRCVDRLAHIVQVHEAMKRRLQRPLKVLDLGCAQGFFSCSLAALGAQVVGIDHTAQNIRLCEELARESPSLQLEFVLGSVEEFIAALTPGQFDLVLGLSVFHHIVHERGVTSVTELLGRLSQQIEVGVFEMALRTEGPYWSASQPSDPRQLLDPYSFVVELGKVETHLSQERRPLYAASRTLAVLGEEAFQFDEVKTQSHALADNTHVGTRRYYFSDATVIKLFRVDAAIADHNQAELERERDFLATHGEALPFLPRLLAHGTGPAEIWLVREKLPGRLLMDLIADGSAFDGQKLVADVLEQATALESLGLYHGDLRTWNVLVGPGSHAILIDYGAIKRTRADNVWPDDVFLSFLTFLYEVAHRRVVRVLPMRAPFISPSNLPFPYRELAAWLWELPTDDWSFAGLKNRWADLTSSAMSETVSTGNELWQGAVERYLLALADGQDEGRSTHGQNEHIRMLLAHLQQREAHALEERERLHEAYREVQSSLEIALDEARAREKTTKSAWEVAEAALHGAQVDLEVARTRHALELDLHHAERRSLEQRLSEAQAHRHWLQEELERQRLQAGPLTRLWRAMFSSSSPSDASVARGPGPGGGSCRGRDAAAPRQALVSPSSESEPNMKEPPESVMLDQLLILNDVDFVRAAYRALLKREADPMGEQSYVRLLRSGHDKVRLLGDMARSEEARRTGASISGLRSAVVRRKLCRLPVVGPFALRMGSLFRRTP